MSGDVVAAIDTALIAIEATLERDTPPEAVFIEPQIDDPWLYVDGTWIECDFDTLAINLAAWERAGRYKWGDFVKRYSVVVAPSPETRQSILEQSRIVHAGGAR